jgi:hypothetical protein
MMYGGEYMVPLKTGHTPDLPRAVYELKLAGGVSRQIRNQVSPLAIVPADYLLQDCWQIEWFKAWYRVVALEGGASFTAKLSVNGGPLQLYTVQFSAPPVIVSYGFRGVLSAKFEVLSGPITV